MGSNYGWMLVAWGGTDYDGSIIGDGSAWKPGLIKPIYRWIPSIAVSDFTFYQGEKFQELNKKVLLTSLKAQKLISLDFKDGKVLSEETLIENMGRLRDVEFNGKGEIFIIGSDSGIWKLKKNN
jgi:glucose/arabinose dehydrogenase